MNNIMNTTCKYCANLLEDCIDEGLVCTVCKNAVHIRCLVHKSVPGGLSGDVFYTFTCKECSLTKNEVFKREKLSWLKIIVLVLYHLQNRSPGLSKKGYFHWRNHIAALINQNWDNLFHRDIKRKKKWIGTVAGTLSHFNNFFFKSGTAVINETAWWALMYPKLSPNLTSNIYLSFTSERQRKKLLKIDVDDAELFQQVLDQHVTNKELLNSVTSIDTSEVIEQEMPALVSTNRNRLLAKQQAITNKRKHLLPTLESTSKKLNNLNFRDDLTSYWSDSNPSSNDMPYQSKKTETVKETKLLDPMCHYNTSLSNASQLKGSQMKVRIMGGIRKEMILSPYSSIYLKPYIRRDVETVPPWIRLLAAIQLKANENNVNFELPPRAPLDYTYVQPEHIPAVNSLCNQFFWSGIDLTESLQYPDFSCVVLYKKLVVAFAFLVPNVQHTENYISFIFTRPGWRNCGIAKFMLYHLIQTSLGKDITIHVSINNPALFLYQKFGFKVESVALHFYDKYLRSDTKESKHAFFCRLER